VIQFVCASSEVALEPWRSCSLLVTAPVQVMLTEVSTMYISLEVWGHVTTDGQSVSMSWRRAHLGTCDQILILSEFCCVVFVGCPFWREVGSVSRQSLSAIIVHRQVLFLFFCFCLSPPPPHFTCHTFYVYTIYARHSQHRLSTAVLAPSLVAYTTMAV
jgi:hypothetical protein